ncbi:MAG: hypothetical protein HRU15_00370 [Planctomycetes bacterium]|nr:hypothetical protein [Planctomycetota bacterium]
MKSPFWGIDKELCLVAGQASVLWLQLRSPFGDSPVGLDMRFELPEGIQVMNPAQRPVFGVGPDAHRPVVHQEGRELSLSFPGFIPGEIDRRPFTHRETWCDLHYPLVFIAEEVADGGEIRSNFYALGDSDHCELNVTILSDPGIEPPVSARRNIEPNFLPWFSHEEQSAIAVSFRRCGFSDVTLNWFNHGMPVLPQDAYAVTAKCLRKEIPGVKIWIGGMPGADTIVPRARDIYGRSIPHIASPEADVSTSPDIVVASERSWAHAVDADGIMITITEPSVIDTPFMPANCFSAESRARFAREIDLEVVPDPIKILDHYRNEWVEFCCRQISRMLSVLRMGIGDRPIAICALGPGGSAREEAGVDWQQIGDVADILIYAHQSEAQPAPETCHWGCSRVGSSPQLWWEEWHDNLGNISDSSVLAADMKMQLALSGNQGIRFWSWPCLIGNVQRQLMEWR